jgi:hypothetical protein
MPFSKIVKRKDKGGRFTNWRKEIANQKRKNNYTNFKEHFLSIKRSG